MPKITPAQPNPKTILLSNLSLLTKSTLVILVAVVSFFTNGIFRIESERELPFPKGCTHPSTPQITKALSFVQHGVRTLIFFGEKGKEKMVGTQVLFLVATKSYLAFRFKEVGDSSHTNTYALQHSLAQFTHYHEKCKRFYNFSLFSKI